VEDAEFEVYARVLRRRSFDRHCGACSLDIVDLSTEFLHLLLLLHQAEITSSQASLGYTLWGSVKVACSLIQAL
jgi:hypothetical protein